MPSSASIFSKPGWLNCGNRLLCGRLRTSISSSIFESRRSLTNWGKSRLEWPTVKRGFTPLESGSEQELRATKTPCYRLILPQGCEVEASHPCCRFCGSWSIGSATAANRDAAVDVAQVDFRAAAPEVTFEIVSNHPMDSDLEIGADPARHGAGPELRIDVGRQV